MALTDTARLVIELALRGNAATGLQRVDRQLATMDRTMTGVNTRISRTGQVINTALGVGLERVVTSGIAAAIGGIRNGVEEMQRLEDANLQTAAAIKSTDGIAGQTVAGIRQMAEDFEALNATVDDKAIQEAANRLLTFRRVGDKAFEPALEAALDLSTRMGGDLNGAIVQVGKALEDPIRGVTALRRVGVQLTDQQEDQIKTLVEQNRLYDAQQIILRELNTQVGGSFAAQGQGDSARAAALRDRLEDLQRVAAEGLAPGLTRVREALIGAFDNPQVISGVRAIGENIAGFLSTENLNTAGGVVRDVFGFLGSVPWRAIGDGLQIVGRGAKLAIDAFNALPREVQGIVIAGLAVNKLSGGIAGSLAVEGIKGIVSGLKTITAANVTVIGGNVTGGPGGVAGRAGGGVIGGLKTAGAIAAIPLVGVAAVEVINFQEMRNVGTAGLEGILDRLDRNNVAATNRSIERINAQINQERPFLEGILFNTNVKPVLERELAELVQVRNSQREQMAKLAYTEASLNTALRQGQGQTNVRLDTANARLAVIAGKNLGTIINKTENRISSTVIQQRTTQTKIISGTTRTIY